MSQHSQAPVLPWMNKESQPQPWESPARSRVSTRCAVPGRFVSISQRCSEKPVRSRQAPRRHPKLYQSLISMSYIICISFLNPPGSDATPDFLLGGATRPGPPSGLSRLRTRFSTLRSRIRFGWFFSVDPSRFQCFC